MKVVRNITIDIYYKKEEETIAIKKIKSYEKRGYDYSQTTDEPGEYPFCAQLIFTTIKENIK